MDVTKSVYELLQEVRVELSKTEMAKSGYNAFAKFKYFELKDFLPKATELFAEKGLTPVFWIDVDPDGVERAYLDITSGTQHILFKAPTAEANNSSSPIQNAGSKITYFRRYLYTMALDIVENDVVDASEPVKEKPVATATPLQVETIYNNRDKLIDVFKEKGIKNKNGIKALTIEEASEIIKSLETANDTNA